MAAAGAFEGDDRRGIPDRSREGRDSATSECGPPSRVGADVGRFVAASLAGIERRRAGHGPPAASGCIVHLRGMTGAVPLSGEVEGVG